MPEPMEAAAVVVAPGSAANTWEVAAILSEALGRLGLMTKLAGREPLVGEVPIVLFGRGATASPVLPEAQAHRAVVIMLGGPGTPAFDAATGLAGVAAGCFAVSPRTISALSALGTRAERFVLGYADQWDTGGITNRPKRFDVICAGEVDHAGRRVLARIATELAAMRSHIRLPPGHASGETGPSTFQICPMIADARLTLSLNGWDETTLDWVTTVRAMCNGSVVIAERAQGCGGLVPGEHFLMARADRLGPAIRAAANDPDAVVTMAAGAYEFCRTQLSMGASIERVASAVEHSSARLRWSLRLWRARPTLHPRRHIERSTGLKTTVMEPPWEDPDPDVEVDVICVEHRDTGPISLTRQSLAGHPVRLNLHVGTADAGHGHGRSGAGPGIHPLGASVAAARNDLVRRTSAPLVMFIDPGDEVLPGALTGLAAALGGAAPPDICVPIVALGSDDLIHPWLPSENPRDGDAPQRGYVVRRAYLDRMGAFVGGGGEAAGVDRAFWRRAGAQGARVALLPQIGLRLRHAPRSG